MVSFCLHSNLQTIHHIMLWLYSQKTCGSRTSYLQSQNYSTELVHKHHMPVFGISQLKQADAL